MLLMKAKRKHKHGNMKHGKWKITQHRKMIRGWEREKSKMEKWKTGNI